MTEHTPGPWRVDPAFFPEQPKVYPDNGSGDFAHICRVNAGPDGYQANARVIAAAPDLLAALEDIEQWDRNSYNSLPNEFRQAMRAAIAKARAANV